jgi:integrase
MAGVWSKPSSRGKYRGWFTNYEGERVFFTGTTSKTNTRDMANHFEDQHRQIKLGYLPPPSCAERQAKRPFWETVQEHMTWGRSQGGRRGYPWAELYADSKERHLTWWREQLGLEVLGDLQGILADAECALRGLQEAGRAGKTINDYVAALRSFIRWCIERDYMASDPLRRIAKFDETPSFERRALTPDEVERLLGVASRDQRMLYEVALTTGLRAGELRKLTVDHLDVERGGLILDAPWTKNRKGGFQPLPRELVQRLVKYAEAGHAKELYADRYKHSQKPCPAPINPLLFVSAHPARDVAEDLERAGIPWETSKGRFDFHACRGTYISYMVESGASIKEVETLARHSTVQLTMSAYAKARDDRLCEVVESVGKTVFGKEKRALCVHLPQGAENENAVSVGCPTTYGGLLLVPRTGFKPVTSASGEQRSIR